MNFSASLTKFSEHFPWIRILQKRFRDVNCNIPLEILQLRPDPWTYQKLYRDLLIGITFFLRKEYWQYSCVFSPNVLPYEASGHLYENIFLWEKEDVLEKLGLDYDPDEYVFTRPYPKEIVDLMHGCYSLSFKKLIRHVPAVYVILYADGTVYFCDGEKNRLSFPEFTLSSEIWQKYWRVTVGFLHITYNFYADYENLREEEYPKMFQIYVYDVTNSDEEV